MRVMGLEPKALTISSIYERGPGAMVISVSRGGHGLEFGKVSPHVRV